MIIEKIFDFLQFRASAPADSGSPLLLFERISKTLKSSRIAPLMYHISGLTATARGADEGDAP
jgi:hypothetical protein